MRPGVHRPGTRATGRPVAGGAARRGPTARRPITRRGTRSTRRTDARTYRTAAQGRLRAFRQSTALAVAVTGLVLLVWGAPDAPAQGAVADTAAAVADTVADTLAGAFPDTAAAPASASEEAARSAEEAAGTVRGLVRATYRALPKLVVALLILAAAAVVTRLVRPLLRGLLASYSRAEAVSALAGIAVWLVALGAALSVLAGDARALLGSVGLFGLALSWALQAPIESFSGWLLNSFRGYYRVGDRILVGDVFGDVYRIDFLTTTVWEAGGPGKPVQGAQPTGALITFPNSEVVRANITNYTRDFPYVWDEVVVGVTNESELRYAVEVIRALADRVVGGGMAEPVARYAALLDGAGLAYEVATRPQVYVSTADSWTDLTVRYLVPARERRVWASTLQLELADELARAEHAGRIVAAYPTRRVELQPAPAIGAATPPEA